MNISEMQWSFFLLFDEVVTGGTEMHETGSPLFLECAGSFGLPLIAQASFLSYEHRLI
jgi:hypothetical protein